MYNNLGLEKSHGVFRRSLLAPMPMLPLGNIKFKLLSVRILEEIRMIIISPIKTKFRLF